MSEPSDLLKQLRIDRSGEDTVQARAPRRWPWALGVALAVLVLAGAGLYVFGGHSAIAVAAVTASPLADSGGVAAVSQLDASGYVVARRQATVSAKITGKVVELNIEEGQHVSAGEVIARLDDTNVRAALAQTQAQRDYAQASLAQLRVNLGNAERDLRRKRGLVTDRLISQADLDNAQTAYDALRAELATAEQNVVVSARAVDVAQRSLDDTVVRAPFAGVVTVKAAQPGEIVSPISAGGGFTRTGIGTIVDMDSLEVEVDVNESFIGRVHAGQPAQIRLNAYPDWTIPASVIAVIPTADRSKATVKVRVGFKTGDPRVLPEMGARVAFLAETAAPDAGQNASGGLAIPANAVQISGDTGVVYLIRDDHVERRAVHLGAKNADRVVVLSGLNAGERLAAGDLGQLADGVKIRVTP